jgi:hypothetical protein
VEHPQGEQVSAKRVRRRAYFGTGGKRGKRVKERLESLDDYASKISWLLYFLYNRYDKFADLETEIQEGLSGVTGDTSIGEADAKYKDLKKALRLVRVTVKASERMEHLVSSINAQLSQIREDFQDEKEEEKELRIRKADGKCEGRITGV